MSSPQVEHPAKGAQDALFDGDFGPLPEDLGFRVRSPASSPTSPPTTRLLGQDRPVTPEIRMPKAPAPSGSTRSATS